MNYLFLIIGSLVILTCIYFIVTPFFLVDRNEEDFNETETSLTLEQIYSAVNDLEMEYLMKKITYEDFEKLKEHYQMLSEEVLQKEKKVKSSPKSKVEEREAEAAILSELAKLRNQKG